MKVSSQYYNLGHLTRSKVADQSPLVYSENAPQNGDRKQGTKHRGPTARNQCTNMAEVTSAFAALSTRSLISHCPPPNLSTISTETTPLPFQEKRNNSEDMHLTFRERSNKSCTKLTSCRTSAVCKISINLTSAICLISERLIVSFKVALILPGHQSMTISEISHGS